MKQRIKFIYIGKEPISEDGIHSLKNYSIVNTLSDFLNASKKRLPLVVANEDEVLLYSLFPKERPYGWVLNSSNVPVYLQITKPSQFQLVDQYSFDGIASDNLELLINSQKKVETLSS